MAGIKRLLLKIFFCIDRLYREIDGVAMGSPLAPSLANFFLGHLEEYNIFTNGTLSHEFKSKITYSFHKELNIEISPIFKTTRLSEFFRPESQTPKALIFNIVYKIHLLV